MKQPIPRKTQFQKAEAFRTWACDLEQRAKNSAEFLEAYAAPDDVYLKLQQEVQPK